MASPAHASRYPTLNLNDTFPNLEGETQDNPDFDLYEYIGNDSWCLIFMHPGDFTPVCTTEMGQAALRAPEFAARNVKICGFSCNDAASHRAWIRDIEVATGGKVDFPMFADGDRAVARDLGFLDMDNRNDKGLPMTVRSVYILKPDKTIALMMTYPASTGRSFDEILRVVDSVIRTADKSVATPVDWQPGDDVIINFPLTNKAADEKFGKDNYTIVDLPSEHGKTLEKNYLRITKDPGPVPPDAKKRQQQRSKQSAQKAKGEGPKKVKGEGPRCVIL